MTRPLAAALVIAGALLAALGAVAPPARAATTTCSADGSVCTTSSTLPDGSAYTTTFDATTGTYSFTSNGKTSGSGSFILFFGPSSVEIVGSETINGVTSQIDCTISASGGHSGQCGVLPGFLDTVAAANTGPAQQAALSGSSQAILRSETELTRDLISARIRALAREMAAARETGTQQPDGSAGAGYYGGLSTGGADRKWGFWSDASGSYLSDDSAAAGFEGYGTAALAGVDYRLGEAWLLGFAAGYLRADLEVKAIHGIRLSNGAQLGPYASYVISSHFSLDALFAYARLANGFSGIGNFDSNRYTGAANVNAFYDVGHFALTGFAGYAYALESPAAGLPPAAAAPQPTLVRYGSLKIGGEAAYPLGDFEPYVPLSLAYETTRPLDGAGRLGVTIGIGTRYRINDAVKAGFLVTTEEARSHSTNVVAGASLRIAF